MRGERPEQRHRVGRAIWVARHGNRADFVDPTWAAAAPRPHDPGLSVDGAEQARELGKRLIGSGIRHIFSSPFLRTVQTASCVADALDLGVRIEHGICEWLNPVWYNHDSIGLRAAPGAARDGGASVTVPQALWLPTHDMARSFPRVDAAYPSRTEPEFPEADERLHCWPRAARAAQALAREFADDFLIVCHASPMLGIVYGLLSRETELDCGLCSFAKLVWDGQSWTLAAVGSGITGCGPTQPTPANSPLSSS